MPYQIEGAELRQLTHPPMAPVHVGGVLLGLRVTVHVKGQALIFIA